MRALALSFKVFGHYESSVVKTRKNRKKGHLLDFLNPVLRKGHAFQHMSFKNKKRTHYNALVDRKGFFLFLSVCIPKL